ncbi:hypothetical protein [Prauserella muralis]|uniref:hypothetical protein n=1 Tax=Prauserella muralis TaxID=588067 RepID=UPI0011BD611D|nr:hypothetical protein [Prauserella muralis]
MKRLAGPSDMATQDVTYIEALLVPWTKARAWATEKNREGRWREVRAYNLDKIHAWLDHAPATTAWLAAQVGKALPGVRSIGAWWTETWLPSTRVPLNQTIVLAGREKAAEDLAAMLSTGRRLIKLSSDLRPDEARAFIAAALERTASIDASRAGARSLSVTDATSLARLVAQPQPLILALDDAALARDLPVGHSHQLIVNAAPGQQPDVTVPRLDSEIIATELRVAGVSHDQVSRLGNLGRRSLLALRRALAYYPDTLTPAWAREPNKMMRRLLLVNSWRAGHDEDRRIAAELTGQSYEQVDETAQQLSQGPDEPFVGRVDDIWHVLSSEDAWTLLASAMTADDLQAFRGAALEVFTELDPVLEMAPSERWMAGFYGTTRRFSHTLRTGLAESLVLLAVVDSTIQGTVGRTTAEFARHIVADLLNQANADDSYRLWLSISDILTLLAEAAPDEFLDAMRIGMSGDAPAHVAMFTEDQEDAFGLGSRSPHIHFLWALEVLAWKPEYIDEVVEVLTALAAMDPGGRIANRPLSSLVGILSAWCPNTTANAEDRIRCIRRIARREPRVARRLLPALIPERHTFQTAHAGPKYRDWERSTTITYGDLDCVIKTVVELATEMIDTEVNMCVDLIDKIDLVPPNSRLLITDRLKALGTELSDGDSKTRAFEALREKIAYHQEYSDTEWALPQDQLSKLQEACAALTPSNPVLRHAWLFRKDWITLGETSRRDDFEAHERQVSNYRSRAVGEILTQGGVSALMDLAAQVLHPSLIGIALANYSDGYDEDMLAKLPDNESPERDVASGYISQRLRHAGTDLRDRLISNTHDHLTQARVLRLMRRPSESWEKLGELSPTVREHYWREFVYYGLGHDFAHACEAAWALLDVGRAAAALDLIQLYSRTDDPGIEVAEIIASGLEALVESGQDDPEVRQFQAHDFERLFGILSRYRDAVGLQRVVHLEWQLFPIMTLETDAPTLHRAIVENPAFFCELVAYSHRPDNQSEAEEDGMEERRRALASRAYEVLRSCRRCPGVTADGEIDAATLRSWVHDARTQLRAADRVTAGDRQIGEFLANSPPTSNGAPINEIVRDIIEELCSADIERGIEIGIYNLRGTTVRGITEGGAQERQLAEAFELHSEQAREWPRTRRLLKRVGELYAAEARRNEAEAERRRQGLDR